MRRLRSLLLACLAPVLLMAQDRGSSAVRLLRVPLPSELAGEWSYTVEADAGIRAIGTTSGAVTPSRSAPLLVSLQLGNQLDAGQREVGRVVLRQGAASRTIPLVVSIAAQRALEMHAAIPLRMATSGEDVELLFTLRNGGNAADSVVLDVRAPEAWGATVRGVTRLVVDPRAALPVRIALRVPTSIQAGGTAVIVRAVGLAAVAEAQSLVEVAGTRGQASRGEALRLTSSLTMVGSTTGNAQQVAALELGGAIAPGVSVHGTLAGAVDFRDPGLVRGGSTVGLPLGGSSIGLTSRYASIQVGRVGLQLPGLAGRSLGGEGAALTLDRIGSLSLAAVRSETDRSVQGAVTWRSTTEGPLRVEAAASRLRLGSTGLGAERALTAVSVGARYTIVPSTVVGLTVADRRTDAEGGLGVALDAAWDGARGRARVQAQHAPGGSNALAIARDNVTAEGMFQLTEAWSLTAHGWGSQDGDELVGASRSFGGSIAPARRIGRNGQFGAMLSASGFRVGREGMLQGAFDTDLGVRASTAFGITRVDLEASQRVQDRWARGATLDVQDRLSRTALRSGVSMAGAAGSLALRTSFAAATASQSSEFGLQVQASELRPVRAWPWLSLEGSVSRSYLGMAAMDNARAALRAQLPGEFAVIAGVEHEAWQRQRLVPSRTAFALRVVRNTFAATGDRWRQRTGVVFEDLDDDGVRDEGEPAVPDVTIRAGSVVVTTDHLGRYRLPIDGAMPELDVRSLRLDQRPGRRAADERWALPVRTVARLEVAILKPRTPLVTASTSSQPTTSVVTVRNADGREWRVVANAEGVARFDALPIGEYVISAAATESPTALRVDDRAVVVARGSALPGAPAQRIELVPQGRLIKMANGEGLGVNAMLNGTTAPATTTVGGTQQKQQQQQQRQQQQQQQQQQRQQQ
ncbi:MAG: hypothetical protein ACO3F5_02360 [Gemmatimonadaceae bacterium]